MFDRATALAVCMYAVCEYAVCMYAVGMHVVCMYWAEQQALCRVHGLVSIWLYAKYSVHGVICSVQLSWFCMQCACRQLDDISNGFILRFPWS